MLKKMLFIILFSVLFINCDPYTRSPTVCGFIGAEFIFSITLFYAVSKLRILAKGQI